MPSQLHGTGAVTLPKGDVFGRKTFTRQLSGFDVCEVVYPPSLSLRRHDHENAALCVVIDGAYEEFYGQRSQIHRPGSLVMHPAGEHHSNEHAAAPVRMMIVEFEASYLETLQERLGVAELSASVNSPLTRRQSMGLLGELRRDDPASDLAIEATVLDMVVASARAAAPISKERPGWLVRVEEILRATTATPSLQELAALAGVHPVHLSRTFRRHFGYTIAAFVRAHRISQACAEIENGVPLIDVANMSGYNDQSHFTREFRKVTGTSPGRYRRRTGGQPS